MEKKEGVRKRNRGERKGEGPFCLTIGFQSPSSPAPTITESSEYAWPFHEWFPESNLYLTSHALQELPYRSFLEKQNKIEAFCVDFHSVAYRATLLYLAISTRMIHLATGPETWSQGTMDWNLGQKQISPPKLFLSIIFHSDKTPPTPIWCAITAQEEEENYWWMQQFVWISKTTWGKNGHLMHESTEMAAWKSSKGGKQISSCKDTQDNWERLEYYASWQ